MDVLLEPLEGAQRKFRVVFSDDEVRSKVNKEIRQAAKGLKVPGYRVGRVPDTYIRSRAVFLSSVYEGVTEDLRQNVIDALVKEGSGTVVYLDPEPFSVAREHETDGITVQGLLEVFELPEGFVFEGVSLSPEEKIAVSEEEIVRETETLSKRAGSQFVTDLPEKTPIEDGDLVSFAFSFSHPDTGLPYESRQTVNVGDPSTPEELMRALIGRTTGEVFTERLPFNIPGKKNRAKPRVEVLEARITIESLKRLEPATPDALVALLSPKTPGEGDPKPLADLVRDRVLERKVSEVLTRKMEELVVEILARNTIAVPEKRIDLECERMAGAGNGVPGDLDREKIKRETVWWFTLDGLAKNLSVQPDMQRVEHEYLALVRQGGSPDKDETRRREYIEQAFLSARRRLTEEVVLRKSTFPGWDDFFGPGGLVDTLGWKNFGVARPAHDHAQDGHDHAGHDHSDHDHAHSH